MNFNPNLFGPVVGPVVRVNPPIVHRRVNDVHRVFVTEQPHILEDQTRIFNHHILRHTCCARPICCEFNDCHEENCCNIPGLVNPGCGCGVQSPCAGPSQFQCQQPVRPPFNPNR